MVMRHLRPCPGNRSLKHEVSSTRVIPGPVYSRCVAANRRSHDNWTQSRSASSGPSVSVSEGRAAGTTATVSNAQSPSQSSTAASASSRLPIDKKDAIMMQSFGWKSCQVKGWYKILLSKVPDMQAAGVTHLWLPPPSQSVSAQGYMPGQLYNLNSKYGTKEELIELNKALKAAGIRPVADIVINHRCADEQVDGVWNKFRDDVDHNNKKIDWGKWAITGNDPVYGGTGNPDTGEDYGPAPDLDHLNPDLRAALTDWLLWLKNDIGFEGWRLDFVKGYGARFVDEYISATVGKDVLNVGEFWVDLRWNGSDLDYNQDAARQRLVDWINENQKSSTAFDFVTKGILQEAVKHTQYHRMRDKRGKAPGLLGWWPSQAVTFVDNHDTGSSQNHWPFPSEKIGVGYAYIMTHPGIPCIFWEHYFDWGSKVKAAIDDLVAVRKRNGIHADSKLEILAAEHDMYVARVDDKVIVKLGPKYDIGHLTPKESDGWKKVAKGPDYCVWDKTATGPAKASTSVSSSTEA